MADETQAHGKDALEVINDAVRRDAQTKEKAASWVLATATNTETGEETVFTVEQVLDRMQRDKPTLDDIVQSCYTVTGGYGGGLVEIDLHPEDLDVLEGSTIPLIGSEAFDNAGLRPGKYFGLYHVMEGGAFTEGELARIREGKSDGLLLASDAVLFAGDGYAPIPVTVSPRDEQGEAYPDAPYDFIEAWLMRSEETGAFATVYDMLGGITAAAALQLTAMGEGALWWSVRFEEGEEPGEPGGGKRPMYSITTQPTDSADFPLDKVNANVWKLLEGAPSGQYGFDFGGDWVDVDEGSGHIDIDFNVANKRDKAKGIAIPVTYCIDFSELEGSMTKKLEPYDKRVCIAVAALYNAGYEVMTLQQIYNAMGNTGTAGKRDKEKIDDSITKMDAAKLHLDNLQEANAYNQAAFRYRGRVMPIERVDALVNGQLVESAVHALREPPPISFAKERKQFTTVEVKLLDSPLSKTSANIQLEDYLIERISRIKRDKGKTPNKMLFATIYKHTGIHTRMQKQRAPEKIEKLLKYYKDCGFITGYSMEADGVKVFY